jgi:heme/copper-type cytochrome/quinol oxidase subunit 3
MTRWGAEALASSTAQMHGPSADATGVGESQPRLRRYRLALALALIAIALLIVSFSSAYVVRRSLPGVNYSQSAEELARVPLPLGLLSVDTVLLLTASACLEFARRRKPALGRWAMLPLAGFVAGQLGAAKMVSSAPQTAASSFFLLLCATHGLCIVSGVGALLYVSSRKPGSLIATDLPAWWTHGMSLLWMYIFAFLWLV